MLLPSDLRLPTTESVGYFDVAPDRLAGWLKHGLGPGWSTESVRGNLLELVEMLPERAKERSRLLVLPADGWSAVLTDGPLGTDLGVLPSRAAEHLGCMAIRAVVARGLAGGYPATILTVYGPEGRRDAQWCRRSLHAADDGGRWDFNSFGKPFDFERVDLYRKRRVRDRFTPEMLEEYLSRLGVPLDRMSARRATDACMVTQRRTRSARRLVARR